MRRYRAYVQPLMALLAVCILLYILRIEMDRLRRFSRSDEPVISVRQLVEAADAP